MSAYKFVGRTQELKILDNLARQKTASLIVIRGRRRIGKSRLVKEFAENRCTQCTFLSFSGLPPDNGITAQDQRNHFCQQLLAQLSLPKPDASDWYNLFLALKQALPSKRTVILFDEISWMASGDPTFLPKLKSIWDDHFSHTPKLMFFLCGSVSSWVNKNILSSTGFFGRIKETLTLDEISLSESLELLSASGFMGSFLEKLLILSISGGVPWYIELLAQGKSADDSLMRMCFSKDGILVEEFQRIFHDLFGRRSDIYSAIVRTLVSGEKSHREIANDIEYHSSGPLSEYLSDLVLSGFLSDDRAWSFKPNAQKKNKNYRLKDNYLRFYLKYIEPNLDRIQDGLLESTSFSALKGFHAILGLQIENLVLRNRSLIFEALGIHPENVLFAGPHLKRPTKNAKGCQIDLLIQTKMSVLYVCEVKAVIGTHPLGVSVIEEVKEKINALQAPKNSAVIPILIHFGEISSALEESEYFPLRIDLKQKLMQSVEKSG